MMDIELLHNRQPAIQKSISPVRFPMWSQCAMFNFTQFAFEVEGREDWIGTTWTLAADKWAKGEGCLKQNGMTGLRNKIVITRENNIAGLLLTRTVEQLQYWPEVSMVNNILFKYFESWGEILIPKWWLLSLSIFDTVCYVAFIKFSPILIKHDCSTYTSVMPT